MCPQKAGEKPPKGLSAIPSSSPADASSKLDAVVEEFRRERDRRNGVKSETTSWQLKLLLPCLIVIAAIDLADLLGYIRVYRGGNGIGTAALVFALVVLFVSRYRKNR